MLCTNGHNNPDTSAYCSTCGANTFQPGTVGTMTAGASAASGVGYNGMAIASMVLGIVWTYWIGSILALVFGYVARRQIKRSGQRGNAMAVAGIVLGWVGVAALAAVITVVAFSASSISTVFRSVHDVIACQADGQTAAVAVAVAAFEAQRPGQSPTEADLVSAANGGPYIEKWPVSSAYTFTLTSGTLFVQSTQSGSRIFQYMGIGTCSTAGIR